MAKVLVNIGCRVLNIRHVPTRRIATSKGDAHSLLDLCGRTLPSRMKPVVNFDQHAKRKRPIGNGSKCYPSPDKLGAQGLFARPVQIKAWQAVVLVRDQNCVSAYMLFLHKFRSPHGARLPVRKPPRACLVDR